MLLKIEGYMIRKASGFSPCTAFDCMDGSGVGSTEGNFKQSMKSGRDCNRQGKGQKPLLNPCIDTTNASRAFCCDAVTKEILVSLK